MQVAMKDIYISVFKYNHKIYDYYPYDDLCVIYIKDKYNIFTGRYNVRHAI